MVAWRHGISLRVFNSMYQSDLLTCEISRSALEKKFNIPAWINLYLPHFELVELLKPV